jgi:hypothetical protein
MAAYFYLDIRLEYPELVDSVVAEIMGDREYFFPDFRKTFDVEQQPVILGEPVRLELAMGNNASGTLHLKIVSRKTDEQWARIFRVDGLPARERHPR